MQAIPGARPPLERCKPCTARHCIAKSTEAKLSAQGHQLSGVVGLQCSQQQVNRNDGAATESSAKHAYNVSVNPRKPYAMQEHLPAVL